MRNSFNLFSANSLKPYFTILSTVKFEVSMRTLIMLFLITIFSCSSLSAQSGWFALDSGTTEDLYSVFFADENTGYKVGWNSAVLKTTNAGLNWFSQTLPFPNSRLWSVFFTDVNTGYIAGGVFGGNVYKTTNGGSNWDPIPLPITGDFFNVLFINSSTGYVGGSTNSFSIPVILKTTNAGNSWELQTVPSGMQIIFSINFLNENTGYATGGDPFVTSGNILKTTNGGTNWQEIFFISNGASVTSISFADATTGVAVCGGTLDGTGGIFRTTNGGNNWTDLNYTTGSMRNLWSVKFLNSSTGFIVGTTYSPDERGVILKTINGGANWHNQNSNTNTFLTGCYFANENTGYVVGEYGRTLKTTDGGGSFVGIDPLNNEVPSQIQLNQNYPNPFNPITKISFAIPGNSFVNLRIFDMMGREVATLVNEQLQSGNYETEWNAAGIPSGTYFYKLTANNYSETMKMILIK